MKALLTLTALTFAAIMIGFTYPATHSDGPRPMPTVPERYQPGMAAPPYADCAFTWPYSANEYCSLPENLYLTIHAGRITHTSMYIYADNVRVGDVLAAWGVPEGAEYYGSGSVMLYWPGRMVYVLVSGHFSAYSKVGFFGMGDNESRLHAWRGFTKGR